MATYYLEPGVGNDGNAGGGWGAGNSWATLQKAADTATAGDIVLCKTGETIAARVDFDTNNGDETKGLIRFIGVNAAGANDGTRYVVNCNGANIDGLYFNIKSYLLLENIEVKNSGNGDGISGTGTCSYNVFVNVCSNNNNQFGFDNYNAAFSNSYFIRCCAYSNGNAGFQLRNSNRYIFCSSHDNSQSGFDATYASSTDFIGCLGYDNANDGLQTVYMNDLIFNCAVDGNADDGINLRSIAPCGLNALIGSRVTNHDGEAGDIGVNAATEILLYGWNYFQDNDGDNVQSATLVYAITHNGTATNLEDQADTTEGYTDDDPEDYNLRSDATLRRTAIQIPVS